MDFRSLSFPEAPLIKIEPPGPESEKYLRFLPPLVVTRDVAATGLEIFAAAIQKVRQ